MSTVVSTTVAPPATAGKWLRCTGPQLRKMARAGLVWLEQNRDHVNALNVFPVPDGDTGTNMLLTMRSAYARVENSEELHVGRVAAQLAQGALMGARGNSGVILSQIWRGLAAELAGKETFGTADLAAAFQTAADTAYNDGTSKYMMLNPISLKRLVASGTQLKRFNKEIVQAGFKAANEVYAEHSAKDPFFKKVFDDMRGFQRDQILWNRISELVFTQDMASLKI